MLEKIASLSGKTALKELDLDECSLRADWAYPRTDFKDLNIEEHGKFHLEGNMSLNKNKLSGSLRLGIAPEYLAWLPVADEVFTERRSGYLWTTVHISGTTEKLEQDLSPRIEEALKENPGTYLQLLFRSIGEGLKNMFDHN